MKNINTNRTKWLSLFLAGCMGLLAASWAGASSFDMTVVNKCKECHKEAAAAFQEGNTHFKAWQFRKDDSKYSCETCHGNSDKHIKEKSVESIISFSPEKTSKRTPEEQAKQCLTCHSTQTKELTFWKQGIHNRNGVTCANCHTMHGGADKMKPTSETCFKCHKDVKTQVNKLSHHPIIEGKVSCNDCHNPHGTMSDKNLRAENINLLCYKCHTEKRGPFLYEHPPVAENCISCHQPHGSQHMKLLKLRAPALCQSCHLESSHQNTPWANYQGFGNLNPKGTPPFNAGGTSLPVGGSTAMSARLVAKGCVNCHGAIHGSNQPGKQGLFFVR